MRMMLAAFHCHVSRRQGATLDLLSRNAPTAQGQSPQLGFDAIQLAAGVYQRAQHHVAADAGKTIEVSNLHLRRRTLRKVNVEPGSSILFVRRERVNARGGLISYLSLCSYTGALPSMAFARVTSRTT